MRTWIDPNKEPEIIKAIDNYVQNGSRFIYTNRVVELVFDNPNDYPVLNSNKVRTVSVAVSTYLSKILCLSMWRTSSNGHGAIFVRW
jgi:hypothetical protein